MLAAVLPIPSSEQGSISNTTPQTLALGKARTAFFSAILKASTRHKDYDYSGYRSMLLVDHTTMLWPVGRADRVVFLYTSSGDGLLTLWSKRGSRVERQGQIHLAYVKRPPVAAGTLATVVAGRGLSLPRRVPKPLKSALDARQGYASYTDSAAMGCFYCTVFRADNTEWPPKSEALENVPFQSESTVAKTGFAITEDELRVIVLEEKVKAKHGYGRKG